MTRTRREVRYENDVAVLFCPSCMEWLPLDDFYKNGKQADGETRYHTNCKSCTECERRKNRDRKEDSKCWSCPDLEACKAVIGVLVLIDGEYEPHPLPCYEEKV